MTGDPVRKGLEKLLEAGKEGDGAGVPVWDLAGTAESV
jgi:hypothetical protein